jgi:hypothetical protein
MRAHRLSLLLCLLVVVPSRADDSEGKIVRDRWDVAYLQGNRAGYVHTLVQESEEKGQKLYTSTVTLHLTAKRHKEVIRLRMDSGDTANEQGRVLKVFLRQHLTQDKRLEITGAVEGRELRLTQDNTKALPPVAWDDGVIGLFKQQQFLAERKAKPGDSFSYKTFELALHRAIRNDVRVKGYEDVELLGGQAQERLLRVETKPEKTDGVQLPTLITWVDKDYVPLRSEAEVPGLGAMVLYRSMRTLALSPTESATLTDIGIGQLVSLKERISRPYEAKAAVYRITIQAEGGPAGTFAEDDRQQVKNVQGNSLELVVRASGGASEGQSREPGAEFTKSSYFINSADRRVREIAAEAVGSDKDPWQKALRIEKWVNRNMTSVSDQGLAPADEAARTLKGDCTEYAMLAAAMCRAEGVPSRTAVGLIYAEVPQGPVFAFHMWTEVWVKGRWAPIDATRGRGGISATHLKICDQSWHDTQTLSPLFPLVRVLGKVSIEVLETSDADPVGHKADPLKPPRWTHDFDLKVRKAGEEKFTDKTRAFGAEVFRDDNNGNGVYILDTGVVSVIGGFDSVKVPVPDSKPPAWLHGLDLKVRRTGEANFTDKTQVISLEVFRDANTGNLIYITEKGFFAVAPGDKAAPAPTPSPRPPVWVSGFDLKVRKAGQPRFDDTTRSWSVEVFRDVNTGMLLYVSEAGTIAVVAGEALAPGTAGKQPSWLHGLDLKCRKGGQKDFDPADKGHGMEVHRDNNNGNLIYLCENATLAVVPGGKDLKAPTPKPRQPVFTHGLDLKVRRAGETKFTDDTRVIGVEIFRDVNTGNLIYVTEVGSVSAVPAKP